MNCKHKLQHGILVDCVWGEWSDWSDCSLTCGTGTRTRSRVITTYEENGGTACTGNSVQTTQFDCDTISLLTGKKWEVFIHKSTQIKAAKVL